MGQLVPSIDSPRTQTWLDGDVVLGRTRQQAEGVDVVVEEVHESVWLLLELRRFAFIFLRF